MFFLSQDISEDVLFLKCTYFDELLGVFFKKKKKNGFVVVVFFSFQKCVGLAPPFGEYLLAFVCLLRTSD